MGFNWAFSKQKNAVLGWTQNYHNVRNARLVGLVYLMKNSRDKTKFYELSEQHSYVDRF